MEGNEAPKGYTTPNRQGEYAKIATLLPRAIEVLKELLEHPNCNVRLGAVNKILDKCLPDLRATELTGQNGEPIKFNIIFGNGYIPPTLKSNALSEGDTVSGQPQVQDVRMASESKKNDNSGDGTNQASTG